MSLDQIRTFVAVADTGSMRKASELLHVSQPPLTRQIAKLEDELGAKLFERTPRGMRILDAGAAFLVHARRILDEIERARATVRDRGRDRGRA